MPIYPKTEYIFLIILSKPKQITGRLKAIKTVIAESLFIFIFSRIILITPWPQDIAVVSMDRYTMTEYEREKKFPLLDTISKKGICPRGIFA